MPIPSKINPKENLLDPYFHKRKKRNYSFQKSEKLALEKLTEVNGVKIPSIPGSCYHAIISSLAEYKDKFCPWNKVIELTEQNMRMYGGTEAWEHFVKKNNVKGYAQRIKDNTHTLTRTGRDCYGFRLHERGMCIYFFKDGAMLLIDGVFKSGKSKGEYEVIFSDGRKLQRRYRGATMTYKEYKKFLEKGFIDISGRILNLAGIKEIRLKKELVEVDKSDSVQVCIELKDTFNQKTASRLEKLGLKVDQAFRNELIGSISYTKVQKLRQDKDVEKVEVAGEF